MITKISALLCGMLLSSAALAQEFGLTLGVHQTSASVDTTGIGTADKIPGGVSGSVTGKLGFDAGMLVAFELVPNVRFRTGLLYDQRQFDFKLTSPAAAAGTYSYNFAYLDVPVNVQYNFTPMIGIFGGMIVGIEASDSHTAPSGITTPDPNMKSLYPFANVGLNFMFQDLIGFDLYYETGLGSPADNVSSYNTFGLHFIYWL